MTNTNLWEKVEDFEFDNPNEHYGFSTRLAFENSWTIHFTQSAILEYKKFMYLAATQNQMVSPSETVDKVWHQHLIFTKSYTDLCDILGKRIEHIPSTHKFSEKEIFAKAAKKTKVSYEADFGKQPAEIWDFHEPMDSFGLSRFHGDLFNTYAKIALVFLLLLYPAFLLLRPLLEEIENPYFLIFYVIAFGMLIVSIEMFVKQWFKKLFLSLNENLAISNLDVFELICMKHGLSQYVIHGVVNRLIEKEIIAVGSHRAVLKDFRFTGDKYEDCVISVLKETNDIPYGILVKKLRHKYIFNQFHKSHTKLRQTIISSNKVMRIKYIYFSLICFWLLIGVCRMIAGGMNHKPVEILLVVMMIIVFTAVFQMKRINNYFTKLIIPAHYEKEVGVDRRKEDWKWNYLIAGKTVFIFSFMSLVRYSESLDRPDGSCGSGCSSSGGCGSGCGGCGGD